MHFISRRARKSRHFGLHGRQLYYTAVRLKIEGSESGSGEAGDNPDISPAHTQPSQIFNRTIAMYKTMSSKVEPQPQRYVPASPYLLRCCLPKSLRYLNECQARQVQNSMNAIDRELVNCVRVPNSVLTAYLLTRWRIVKRRASAHRDLPASCPLRSVAQQFQVFVGLAKDYLHLFRRSVLLCSCAARLPLIA